MYLHKIKQNYQKVTGASEIQKGGMYERNDNVRKCQIYFRTSVCRMD